MVDSSIAWSRKISRQKLQRTLCQFEPSTLTAMEVCSISHYRGKTPGGMGFSTQQVKVFVRSQKNYALVIVQQHVAPGSCTEQHTPCPRK